MDIFDVRWLFGMAFIQLLMIYQTKENVMKRIIFTVFAVLTLVCVFSFSAYAVANGKVNINTASVKELATLQKIGDAYSKRIVEYRNSKGPFKKTEDIMKVKGISKKIFELNKDRIVVKDEPVEKKS